MNPSLNRSISLEHAQTALKQAKQKFARDNDTITLVAVSKQQSFDRIEQAYAEGQRHFGENYLQEALPKIAQAKTQHLSIIWHFIGHLQSNKLRKIAEAFDWVQTLKTLEQARQLNRYRLNHYRLNHSQSTVLPRLNCCIQIDVSAKHADITVLHKNSLELAHGIVECESLYLRGLMCRIPESSEFDQQRKYFSICRKVYEKLKECFPFLDTLSMGMSNDFEAAIAEQSNMVRLGRAIFGARGQ